ncbi:CDP-diacylglycerol/glycerol-3-phosphate3-phospha tidyltransferase [Caldithrix abyssi DSM 13497]|nr:CDP-diacylglycerol/glycerol-3-phosphate3-phospha tidyltransferase [Caldithrix abyssi DSM 13497]
MEMRHSIPNQLTIFRILLTPVFVFFFLKGGTSNIRIASIIYLIASITDWYDGYIARRLHMITRLGQFMDPLADKILVSAALAVFAHENYLEWWAVILIITRDFLITGLRLFALYIGKPIITSVIAKWKTFLQMFFIFALLIYLNIPGVPEIRLDRVSNPYLIWTTLSMYLIVVLTIVSGVHYLIVNRSHAMELFKRTFYLLTKPFQSKGD